MMMSIEIGKDYYTYIGADGLLRCRNHLGEIAEASYLVRLPKQMIRLGPGRGEIGRVRLTTSAPRIYNYYQKFLATGLCVACWHKAYATQWPLRYLDQVVYDPAGLPITEHCKVSRTEEYGFSVPGATIDYIINNQRLLKIQVYDHYTHRLAYIKERW